jgi:GNAT superfamily N-acetyltransferase
MDRPAFIVRSATKAEREEMIAVTLAANEEYATAAPPAAWADYQENIVAALTESDHAERFVAAINDVIVGSVLLLNATTAETAPGAPAREYPEIRLLAVVPAARGRGIGRALIDQCIRRAKQLGAPTITLHTTDLMLVAKRMYEQMGFVRDPDRDFSPYEGGLVQGYRLGLVTEAGSGDS